MPQEESSRASDLLWNLIINSGTYVVDCGFCGRTHFTLEGDYDIERDEAAELLRNHGKDPDKYVQHHGDSISWGNLGGKQAVYECSCDGVKKYEQMIWESRHIIAAYLAARADAMTKQSSEAQGLVAKIQESLD